MVARPWVRFWARSVDATFAAILFERAAPLLGVPLASWSDYAVMWTGLVFWIVLEAILMTATGTTPGKWLLRVTVSPRMSFPKSLNRAVQVFIKGLCGGLPLIALGTLYKSHQRLKTHGITNWDESIGLTVTHETIGPLRIAATVFITALSFVLPALGIIR